MKDNYSEEMEEIVKTACGELKMIERYREIQNVRQKGKINVLVEKSIFSGLDYVADKFKIQIVSQDRFYSSCLDQNLPDGKINS